LAIARIIAAGLSLGFERRSGDEDFTNAVKDYLVGVMETQLCSIFARCVPPRARDRAWRPLCSGVLGEELEQDAAMMTPRARSSFWAGMATSIPLNLGIAMSISVSGARRFPAVPDPFHRCP
jgi:hypothetical protein